MKASAVNLSVPSGVGNPVSMYSNVDRTADKTLIACSERRVERHMQVVRRQWTRASFRHADCLVGAAEERSLTGFAPKVQHLQRSSRPAVLGGGLK